MTDREIIEKAHKRVKDKKDFYSHLTSYIITISFLLFINIFTAPGYLWVVWPAMGWGIGLAFHAFGIFFTNDDDWEEKELQKEIERLKRKKKYSLETDDELILEDDPLELKELKKQRADWDDRDFV